MIDIKSGIIKINNNLEFYPSFNFNDFMKTPYFNGQDGIKMIYLNEKQIIDGKTYIIGFFFRNNTIYMVSLINCDNEIPENEEQSRKMIHDEILKQYGIKSGEQYTWGRIESEYDFRSNVSSINIYYNE